MVWQESFYFCLGSSTSSSNKTEQRQEEMSQCQPVNNLDNNLMEQLYHLGTTQITIKKTHMPIHVRSTEH